ncbi:MAG: hypothetical protein ACXVPU_07440 [Bacteroidia bacterium]
MKTFFISVLLVVAEFVSAQHLSFPIIKPVADSIDDFVPAGWKIINVAYGDLNKDKADDVAFVIQSTDTLPELLYNNGTKKYDQEDNSGARILVVLFKKSDAKYHLMLQNNDFILRPDEGGMCCDPFYELKIENATLIIPFYGGLSNDKWGSTYIFRYEDNDWFLIGASVSSSHVEWGDSTDASSITEEEFSYNFLTGKMKTTKSDISSDSKPKEEWREFQFDKQKTFKTLIRPFSWEIEKGIFL